MRVVRDSIPEGCVGYCFAGLQESPQSITMYVCFHLHQAQAFVIQSLASFDASHDYQHVMRVRAMALRLAADEGIVDPAQLEIVELAGEGCLNLHPTVVVWECGAAARFRCSLFLCSPAP